VACKSMRIAFYAPLKPPDHPIPSGDRRVAQLLLDALRLAGHEPVLVSRFRSHDGNGDGKPDSQLSQRGLSIVFSATTENFANVYQNYGSRITFITRPLIGWARQSLALSASRMSSPRLR
jgi:hypothetical protein